MSSTPLPETPNDLTERGVALRPRTDDDAAFSRELYIASRRDEFAALPWPAPVLRDFLSRQFDMQTIHYETHYPGAAWGVVEIAGEPAGRLLLQLSGGDLRVIDIALVPKHRGRGLGTALMRLTQTHARSLGASSISLHVEQGSRAVDLYRRLGFVIAERRGPHMFMTWRSPSVANG